MNTWYKNKIVIAAAVVALILIGFFLYSGGSEGDKAVEPTLKKEDATALNGKSLTVNGEIKCLPYKKEDPNQMCVKGIEGDDGVIYALNGSAIKSPELKLTTGTLVTAKGVFEVANQNSESDVFVYDGVLVLTSIAKQ